LLNRLYLVLCDFYGRFYSRTEPVEKETGTPRFILFVLLQLSSKKSDTIRLNYCIMCLLFKFTKISTYVKIAMFYATYHVCSEIYRILSGEVYSAKLVEFCEYSIIFLELKNNRYCQDMNLQFCYLLAIIPYWLIIYMSRLTGDSSQFTY